MWDYVDFSAYHDASALVMSTVQYYVVTASQGPQRANEAWIEPPISRVLVHRGTRET
jgi:hypothetical protein